MAKFQIKTKRLLLNNITLNDAATMFAYRSDYDVARFQSWKPRSEAQTRDFIAKYSTFTEPRIGEWNQIAIRLNSNGHFIGDSGLHMISKNVAEIGYTIAPSFQGNGYATEAAAAICHYLFSDTEVQSIQASTLTENVASCSVLKKLGFRQLPGDEQDEEFHFELVRDANKF